MAPLKRRPRHPVARLVFLIMFLLIIFIAASCSLWDLQAERKLLGPHTNVIPGNAEYAVATSPYPGNGGIYSRSYLIFLDKAAQPVGHIRTKAGLENQLVRTDQGILYYDADSVHHITRNSQDSVTLGDTAGISRTSSMGINNANFAAAMYINARRNTVLVRYTKTQGLSTIKIPNTVISSTICDSDIYYVSGKTYENSDFQAFSLKRNSNKPQLIAQKTSLINSHGNNIPGYCKNGKLSSFYLNWHDDLSSEEQAAWFTLNDQKIKVLTAKKPLEFSNLGGSSFDYANPNCMTITTEADCIQINDEGAAVPGKISLHDKGINHAIARSFNPDGSISFLGGYTPYTAPTKDHSESALLWEITAQGDIQLLADDLYFIPKLDQRYLQAPSDIIKL